MTIVFVEQPLALPGSANNILKGGWDMCLNLFSAAGTVLFTLNSAVYSSAGTAGELSGEEDLLSSDQSYQASDREDSLKSRYKIG